MKKLLLTCALLVATATIGSTLHAQHINVNINIASQPAWGPTGYEYVDYYYLPDINVYYNVNTHSYIYFDRGRWITARYLPYRYRNYDLYGMYKVVLTGGLRAPWRYNSAHYNDYARYRNYRGQSVIRDSRDTRYTSSRRNTSPWYRESSPNRISSTRATTRPNNSVRSDTSSRPSRNESITRTNSSNRDNSSSSRDSSRSDRNSSEKTSRR